MRPTSFFLCFFLMLISAFAIRAQEPFASVARLTFADLLKTSVDHPGADVTVHNTIREEGLVIEDISWQSGDGQTVPAFIIRREESGGRLPAIVCLHGSSGSRDAMVTREFGPGEWLRPGQAQTHTRMLGWARELARRGYLVLAITQRGLDTRQPSVGTEANVLLAHGHTAMGMILGEIRQGVTYLQGRPDVDPSRIGTTGMSFGGITAFYTFLLDDRISATAPICGGIGSIEVFSRTGSTGYHGTYWWVPGIVPKGDQAAFSAAMAPKPLMLWAPTEDIGMTREAVDHFIGIVRPAYEQAGKPSNFVAHQPPGGHDFTMEAFEAMVEFFNTHFLSAPHAFQ
jgi:dienelactone hydrolase